jgi:sugar lactone lactonase YvrE
MKSVEELRGYIHWRAQAVPASEAAHLLDRATAAWQQPHRPWRRLETVLAVAIGLALAASIAVVGVWVLPNRVAAPKVGPAPTRHTFRAPEGIAVGLDGRVYVSDYSGQRVFRLEKDGRVLTVAGTGIFAEGGDGGLATKATLEAPSGMVFDRNRNLYVADFWGNRIRRIDSRGNITTIAGSGPTGQNMALSNPSYPSGGISGDGGPATSASFYAPLGLALDSKGILYVADSLNGRVRRIGPDGTITSLDASSLPGKMWLPRYLAFAPAGDLYVTDGAPISAIGGLIGGCRIIRVSTTGTLSVVAGTGTCGFSGDGGPATAAQLNDPNGLALDSAGNLYVADSNNQRIRRIDRNGIITTVAGTGTAGFSGDGGLGTRARLYDPFGLGIGPGNKLYIAEGAGRRVRMLQLANDIITTAAS